MLPIFLTYTNCIKKTFECTGVTLTLQMSSFIILSVYRSPSSVTENFIRKFDQVLIFLTKLYPKADIIICGDFNIHFIQPSKVRTHLQDMIGFFNLSPSVFTPTSSTLLDNIFTTLDTACFKIKTVDLGLSDHSAVSLQFIS
jgi:exonuclease III